MTGDGDGDGDVGECGNAVVEPGEQCDDGNGDPFDGCNACKKTNCGDGALEPGEQCDDGNFDTQDNCPDCKFAFCGDGYTQLGAEQCDDGNEDDTDECLPIFCTTATCGDGAKWEGMEACDDGNTNSADACTGNCDEAVCGDGFKWQGVEDCDDGNDVDDDKCANDCTGNGVFYVGEFVAGEDAPQQCEDWDAFRAQLDGFEYTRVALWGSEDPQGVECNGPQADILCQALATGGTAQESCDGSQWFVGACQGIELSATAQCSCDVGYTIRPCIGGGLFGGINTDSCAGPSQTIEVVCQ
jgi:cysteine-rich repeat protein